MASSNVGTKTAETSMYRQNSITDSFHQFGLPIVKSSSSLLEDLHKSRKKLDGYIESKRDSEYARERAEVELSNAMELVKELTLLIERSNRSKKFHKKDMEASKIDIKVEENGEYVEVMRDLEAAKEEVSRLKLDVDSVLGEKVAAEKEVVKIWFKMEEKLRLLESLQKEIEVANEEHFLVESGKMDASMECKEIERMREGEGEEVLDFLVEKNKKIKKMVEEADRSKGIQVELFETTSDVEMLQTQLNLVKKMERRVHRRDKSMSRSFERGKCTLTVLKEVTEETEAKKEALASLNAELSKLMMVMDELRKQINQAREETAHLNKILRTNDVKIQKLNTKMIMAKSKLEIASSAKERVTTLADSLAGSLEKLKRNKEAAKQEQCLLVAQKTVTKMETQKTKLEIDEKERELSSYLDELEKAKQAEALVLEKLESLIEDKMGRRETVSEKCLTITISRFEYEYLSRHASLAEETAKKKVAAAEAWVEALRASTKAVLMKTGTLMRESGMMRVEEEREVSRTERSFSTKRLAGDETHTFKRIPEAEAESYLSPKPVRKSTPVQVGKSRRYSSAGTPTFFVIKKKKVPKLVKLFGRKR